jgi:hypothetical protein
MLDNVKPEYHVSDKNITSKINDDISQSSQIDRSQD